MLEPYAWKQARAVLRELGGGDAARLPGYSIMVKSTNKRKQIDKENISVDYLYKLMRQLFSKQNDCAPMEDLHEVIEELNTFGIKTKKELRLFIKRHRKQLIAIDREPLDRVHQNI